MARYFFFVFLFLLPLQTVYLLREVFVEGEKWQYGVIAIYGTDVILLFSIVAFIFSCDLRKRWQSISDAGCKIIDGRMNHEDFISLISYLLSLILLVLWGALSIAWSDDQALAVYAAVKLVLAAGVFFLARSLSDEDVKIALRVLIVGAVLESLLGIGQFLMQSTFASTLLGMSAHEVWQAGTSVLKNDSGRWLRAYGTFEHPNVLGGFLASILVLMIGYFSSHPSFPRRGQGEVLEEQNQNPSSIPAYRQAGSPLEMGGGKEKMKVCSFLSRISYHLSLIYYPVSLILILLGLILTFSRSAWLGAGMGIAVYYVLRIKYRVWGKWETRMFLTLGIATAIFVGVLHETVFPRFDSVVIEREGSVSERVQSLRDARMVIGEGNMLLGTGAGNFTSEMMRLQSERPIWTIQPAHNVFVLVFAELGLIGLVLFIIFLVSLFSQFIPPLPAYRTGRLSKEGAGGGFASGESEPPLNLPLGKGERKSGAIFVIAIVALAPALLLDHYLWTSHFGLFFLFLLLGFASRK